MPDQPIATLSLSIEPEGGIEKQAKVYEDFGGELHADQLRRPCLTVSVNGEDVTRWAMAINFSRSEVLVMKLASNGEPEYDQVNLRWFTEVLRGKIIVTTVPPNPE